MTLPVIIGTCLSAFGLGYASGSLIRIARKAVEACE